MAVPHSAIRASRPAPQLAPTEYATAAAIFERAGEHALSDVSGAGLRMDFLGSS
jgi:hypothetical protein